MHRIVCQKDTYLTTWDKKLPFEGRLNEHPFCGQNSITNCNSIRLKVTLNEMQGDTFECTCIGYITPKGCNHRRLKHPHLSPRYVQAAGLELLTRWETWYGYSFYLLPSVYLVLHGMSGLCVKEATIYIQSGGAIKEGDAANKDYLFFACTVYATFLQ